jgi:serine/threonine-protein kinase
MKQIGRYEIRNEAGRGGMSTVYEAFDPHFKRAVAIKVMTSELLENDTLKARFHQEAQIIAALEHPAIVPVYDFGEEEMRPFLVMRLMTGGTLAERLKGGALSVSDTARILNRIGSALERAHEQGVIHRDLKPSNIMFDQYGDAFLADFGIARLTEGAVTLTGENVIGTPAYMSPEQIHGDQAVDGRSDIYALGVICFEMLTGRRPFQETAPARLMMQHLIDPVPDIREVRPDLPPGIESIITHSMAKAPEERYEHATEMIDTLDSLASIEAVMPAEALGEDAGDAREAVVGLKPDEADPPIKQEIDEIDVTVPDSAEMAAQQAVAEATPMPPATPEPAAQVEAVGGDGRRKWFIGGAIVFGILLIMIFAAVFFGDVFLSGRDETAEVIDTPAGSEVIEAIEDVISQPEAVVAAQDTAVPDLRPTAEVFMDRFYTSMDAEDYGAAEEAINQAIALAPEESWLHTEKAWLMETAGDFESALDELAIAIELDPEEGEYHARRGNILRELGDLDAALENHLRAVEISPDDPYVHMELAETYKQLDDPGMAVEHYNQALAMKDDDAWFYDARADAYFLLGDYEQGLADLERASQLEPEQRDFFTQAGDMFLHEVEDPERALEYYTRAVERSPDEGWVYADRAAAHEALENYGAALADLDRAIELNPENSSFYIGRGQLYLYALEDLDAALADLNRAVEVDAENPEAFAERAAFFQSYAGDLEAALEDRSRALELEPDGPWRYVDRALVYREMGREEEALADMHRCLELDPHYYWCAWERAWIFDSLGQKREAAADFQRFLELAPEDDCPECREEAERYVEENE